MPLRSSFSVSLSLAIMIRGLCVTLVLHQQSILSIFSGHHCAYDTNLMI
uniref:Uncharacterized protein n=1 Tax=Rhizophora mucronata TaxID=61149 RepID=A0A2P2N482_RHIMU